MMGPAIGQLAKHQWLSELSVITSSSKTTTIFVNALL